MEFIGGHHGGSHCCQRKTLLHVWSLQKSTWTFHSTTGKIFCGQMNPKFSWNTTLCVEKKKSTAHQHQNLIPTVKYGGGGIMVWGCFAASGPGRIAVIDGKMNSQLYQNILQENLRPSVRQLNYSIPDHFYSLFIGLMSVKSRAKAWCVIEIPKALLCSEPRRANADGSVLCNETFTMQQNIKEHQVIKISTMHR